MYIRLDLSITRNTAVEARMKVACITALVLTMVTKFLSLLSL